MTIHSLVKELKEKNEDFEFYPTTDEMLSVISSYLDNDTVLDIGCGTCNFKTYMKKCAENEAARFNLNEEREEQLHIANGERYYKRTKSANDYRKIQKYFVMEKSKTLIQQFDDETICLGTDFHDSTLIDKKVTTIFCNPPYSEFEIWTKKIISEGNYKQAFLVIPQRWIDNVEIQSLLKMYSTTATVLGTFDFLNAERQARAKVNVVRLVKDRYKTDRYSYNYARQDDIDKDAFDVWFNNVFNIKKNEKKENETDYERNRRIEEEKKTKIKNQLVSSEKSKASILVELYQQEYNTLIEHLKKIMELDESVLETFGFSVAKVKEGLKAQISGLKILYWNMVWEEFDEITSRLTRKSRDKIKDEFNELQTVDFTLENIYVLILWVIKNANKYYNSQLIDFFRDLSDEKNVRPYKSNQKLFEQDGYSWNYNREKRKNYVLDYRIIMSSPFRLTWGGEFDSNPHYAYTTLKDIFVIAKNLGFEALYPNLPNNFGETVSIYLKQGTDLFMEYKAYKNGNMHVKFNKEFTKAMNVEVSRLLGWIRTKEDIATEFPEELAKGAEKYFKINNCISIFENKLPLLSAKAS